MESKDIIMVYESLIGSDTLLIEGKEYLERFLETEKRFSIKSCQILASSKINTRFRLYLGTLLKNILIDN